MINQQLIAILNTSVIIIWRFKYSIYIEFSRGKIGQATGSSRIVTYSTRKCVPKIYLNWNHKLKNLNDRIEFTFFIGLFNKVALEVMNNKSIVNHQAIESLKLPSPPSLYSHFSRHALQASPLIYITNKTFGTPKIYITRCITNRQFY